MSKRLKLSKIVERLHAFWAELPDYRQPSNATKYSVSDGVASAFAVFFMQSPSFLAHQRDMHKHKGRDNAATLLRPEHSQR